MLHRRFSIIDCHFHGLQVIELYSLSVSINKIVPLPIIQGVKVIVVRVTFSPYRQTEPLEMI